MTEETISIPTVVEMRETIKSYCGESTAKKFDLLLKDKFGFEIGLSETVKAGNVIVSTYGDIYTICSKSSGYRGLGLIPHDCVGSCYGLDQSGYDNYTVYSTLKEYLETLTD